MLKTAKKSIYLLISNFITLLSLCTISNAICKQEVEPGSLTKISDNLYISGDGILYEETPCNDYDIASSSRTMEVSIFIDQFSSVQKIKLSIAEARILIQEVSREIIENRDYIILPLPSGKPEQSNIYPEERRIIEISPVYQTKFVELNRKLTTDELLNFKRFLLERIDSELSNRYKPKYILIENNNSILRAKIEHMHGEITSNNWENLELTVVLTLAESQRIDIAVFATLYIGSGLKISVPHTSSYSVSTNDYNLLEQYIRRLITYLKDRIVIKSKAPSLNFILPSNPLSNY